MKQMKILQIGMVCLLLLSVVSVALAFGEDVKARMQERLPLIIELKAEGIVGENNQGYLEFRSSNKKNVDDVNAENSDRRTVYAEIARQQGATSEQVGARRAQQIRATIAKPGDWLQADNGRWYQK